MTAVSVRVRYYIGNRAISDGPRIGRDSSPVNLGPFYCSIKRVFIVRPTTTALSVVRKSTTLFPGIPEFTVVSQLITTDGSISIGILKLEI